MKDSFEEKLRDVALRHPTIKHPWFTSIIEGVWTKQQFLAGEIQHYTRVRRNKELFGAILQQAKRAGDAEIVTVAQANYDDEVVGQKPHDQLLWQLFDSEGCKSDVGFFPSEEMHTVTEAMINFCRTHSALEGMASIAYIELQNSGKDGVQFQVYQALIQRYGFSSYAVENFRVHAEADVDHSKDQIELLVAKGIDHPEAILAAVDFGARIFYREWNAHMNAALEVSGSIK